MNEKILDSKIQIPIRYKNFIERDKLLRKLKQSTEKVVIFNAGAGYGKTTLLICYSIEADEYCSWYHLSGIDNDIMNFVNYLSCSIHKVFHEFEYNYENWFDKSGTELAENMAHDFAIYLSHYSDVNISILLDDFQEIYNEDIYTFLSILINNTSENIRFFIATKGAFPKFLASFLFQGSALVLSDRDLAFDHSDTSQILQEMDTMQDVNLITEAILEYTEGWPAGVVAITLALRHEREGFSKDNILALCKASKVFDYLMYDIYRKQPYDIQTFLVHTSVLHILSVDLCNAVMNSSTAKSVLNYLLDENIFIVILSGKGNVYRYHSIFKDYLNTLISDNTKQEIMRKAALHCLNRGEYEQAISYSMECNDSQLMQSGFELIAEGMIDQGESLTMNQWVEFLMKQRQDLTGKTKSLISSYFYHKRELDIAFEYIEAAISQFKEENNETEYTQVSILKARYYMEQGDSTSCFQSLQSGLDFVKRKYSLNWYMIVWKLVENHLICMNEAEAVAFAEEIIAGSTLYIRGGKEAVIKELKDEARIVKSLFLQHHTENTWKEPEIETKSVAVASYAAWCREHKSINPAIIRKQIIIHCFENGIAFVDHPEQELKWRTKKTYEMFVFLFDKQGKSVNKDNIISALWPEMPYDKAGTLFHTTLSYMRKALAEYGFYDVIITKSSGYAINMECVVSERPLLMELSQDIKNKQYEKVETKKLIDLYKNSYFHSISSAWIIENREFMELTYISCCKELARKRMKDEQYEESIMLLTRIIRINPYSEEFLIMIMYALGEIGDLKGVKACYYEADRIFTEELNVELSEKTKAVYEEVIQRKSRSEEMI